ncbi:MAG TPA: two-component regulator propeller domain-containing protein [Pyrinomonadaceae bacterium]|nr:two-component regulator propeller domain-containing protein [Pyrinomonadaceae bacterium]
MRQAFQNSRAGWRFCAALAVCLAVALSPCPAASVRPGEAPQPQPSGLHLWGAVTLFHGLPSEQVRAVTQDSEGAMWFGTDAGLARYDGRRTQTVTGEGLAGRKVYALGAAAEGALWVGTDDGAFVRASGAEPFRLVAETKGSRVTAVAVPEEGRALLATSDGQVFECRRGWGGSFAARPLVEQLKTAAARSQPLELTGVAVVAGSVVVGTRGRGLMRVGADGAASELSSRPRPFYVEAVATDAEGALVFGAQTSEGDSGLFRAEASRLARPERLTGAATGTVTAVGVAPGGEVYAATGGRGAFRFRPGGGAERFTFEGTAGGLRSDRVNAVHVDREGVVWFGTDRGVCRYDPHGVHAETPSAEGGENNFVRALLRSPRGTLVVGTNRGLYARGEDDPTTWRAVEELRGKTVHALAEDSRGRLLVGTASGLFVSQPAGPRAASTPKFEAAQPATAGATGHEAAAAGAGGDAAPRGGEGFVETEAGAVPAGARKVAAPALTGSVRGVAELGGAVFVATFGRGLERFDGQGQRAQVWPREGDDPRGREAVSLFADSAAGRLWLGTTNAGAFYFDGRQIGTEPALAPLGGSTVWGIGAADGHLWLATARGLYALAPGGRLVEAVAGVDARAVAALPSKDGTPRAWAATAGGGVLRVALDARFGPVVSRLDTEHGLPAQGAFALLAEPGTDGAGDRLLVGTTRGVARYETGRLAPSLGLVRVTASRTHQPEELRSNLLRLDYPQNSFVADFAASSSRTFPEQFQYAFTLEDSEGRVVKQGLSHDSQFEADELPAGRYSLTARAYSLDLVPSEPLRLGFEVARPPLPWTTLALSVLLGLALLALLWAAVQHRRVVRGGEELREANRQLAAARLQLANEAESERRRIARDLHDQTLADLRRLLLLTDEMQRAGAFGPPIGAATAALAPATATAVDPSVLRAEIEAVSQEIRRICEDLSPSVLENVGFAAALEWALASARAHLPPGEQFAYEFDCDEGLEERLDLAPGVQMQVYRIVQEAVNNVCRHAGAGLVRLSARIDAEGTFVARLEDDGRGFDPSERKGQKGRGLAGIRARAALIEAEVRWGRRPPEEGGGTAFVLHKPKAARRDE